MINNCCVLTIVRREMSFVEMLNGCVLTSVPIEAWEIARHTTVTPGLTKPTSLERDYKRTIYELNVKSYSSKML